jgi:hypothetical protein
MSMRKNVKKILKEYSERTEKDGRLAVDMAFFQTLNCKSATLRENSRGSRVG